ncbi:glucokinase [bacterium]|nr:glucokinase [bacterium]
MKIYFCFLIILFSYSSAFSYKLKESVYDQSVFVSGECILGVDIGGTNSDFGFFSVQNEKPVLLVSFREQTKNISDFIDILKVVLSTAYAKYGITVSRCCIGAPGKRSEKKDFSNGGKAKFVIDAKKIKEQTGLKTVYVLNDFEIVGYGLDFIAPEDIVEINKGTPWKNSPKVFVGAGTGVGVSYMLWDEHTQKYNALFSELACTEFSPRDKKELAFAQQAKHPFMDVMLWTHALGGNIGAWGLRKFLIKRKYKKLVPDYKHFNGRKTFATYYSDSFSRRAVDKYIELYARFVRIACKAINPMGGVYIVGGIAAKQWQHFVQGNFLQTFTGDRNSHVYTYFSQIPVYLVKDLNINLYGAVQYLLYELEKVAN